MAITDTWLYDNDCSVIVQLKSNNYDFIHSPRHDGRSGGGVGVLFRNNIKLTSSKSLLLHTSECIINSFIINQYNIRIILIYRPPNSSSSLFFDAFYELISSISLENTFILGDFNFHFWSSDFYAIAFLNLLNSMSLTQLITCNTHISKNILDLIIVPTILKNKIQIFPINYLISDHFAIESEILINNHLPKSGKIKVSHRILKNFPLSSFCSELLIAIELSNKNVSLNNLNQILSGLLDKYAPIKTKFINPSKLNSKWFNDDTIMLKKDMRRCERTFLKNQIHTNLIDFQESKHVFRKGVHAAKSSYYKNKIISCGNNVRKLYSLANTLLGKSKKNNSLPDIIDNLLCPKFSNYFTLKIEKIYNSISSKLSLLPQVDHTNDYSNLYTPNGIYLNKFITPPNPDIFNLIYTAKSSSPLDSLPLDIFKSIASHLTPVLSTIIENSFNTGIFPDKLKHGIISPILKNTTYNVEDFSSYRPISKLSLFSKIFEKIVAKQLVTFINSNNLSCKYQSGFRSNHSTETAINYILNDIYIAIEAGSKIQLLLLDLSSAFDTLSFDILSLRLASLCIESLALNWLTSFFTDRSTAVKINDSISEPSSILFGVPQGSVLGPLLF